MNPMRRRPATFHGAAFATLAFLGTNALAQSTAPNIQNTAFIAPQLYEIVSSSSRNRLYVASATNEENGGGKILGLDPKTLAIVETIPTGAAEPYGVGLNDTTQMLYTTNTRDGNVHAVDLKAGKVAATIGLPSATGTRIPHLREVIVDEATNLIYVTDFGGGAGVPAATAPGSGAGAGGGTGAGTGGGGGAAAPKTVGGDIWIIDGKTNAIAGYITSVGGQVTGIALDKARNRLYATAIDTNQILVIDLGSRTVVARFSAWGARPTNIVFAATGNRLFVTNQGTNDVTVLSATDGTFVETIKTGTGALGINFDPGANRIYVANRTDGTVSVIDSGNYKVVATLKTGTFPNTIAVDRVAHTAYVTNKADGAARGGPAPNDAEGNTVSIIRP